MFPIQPQKIEVSISLPPSMQQMTLIGTKHDPHATEWVDIAIADFIFSNGLPISLVECAKFNKLIQSAGHIPPKYTPSYRKKIAGPLLDNIYQSTYDEQTRSLIKESKVFGIALFGDGATILKVSTMIFFDLVQTTHLHCLIKWIAPVNWQRVGKRMLNTLQGF
jgi:hypothetical protein